MQPGLIAAIGLTHLTVYDALAIPFGSPSGLLTPSMRTTLILNLLDTLFDNCWTSPCLALSQ
jgi:hypothetical protein